MTIPATIPAMSWWLGKEKQLTGIVGFAMASLLGLVLALNMAATSTA
jgi:hypothetical protein